MWHHLLFSKISSVFVYICWSLGNFDGLKSNKLCLSSIYSLSQSEPILGLTLIIIHVNMPCHILEYKWNLGQDCYVMLHIIVLKKIVFKSNRTKQYTNVLEKKNKAKTLRSMKVLHFIIVLLPSSTGAELLINS